MRLLGFVARRVAWSLVILLVMTVITFVLSRVVPANPAVAMAGLGASREQVAAVRQEMGLDLPLPVQYGRYMGGLTHLDLGRSIRTGNSVSGDVARYLPATLELIVLSFVVYLLLAIPLGVVAAARRGGAVDGSLRLLAMVGSAIPVFWLAMLLQEVFYVKLGWLPLGSRTDIRISAPPTVTGLFTIDSLLSGDAALFLNVLWHLCLPMTAIVLSMFAVGLRLTRTSVIHEMSSLYVRSARAKGLSEQRILARHVLRNALNPVVSATGVQLGYLFAWIILIETIFQWPGIGLYAYDSFRSLDYAPIMALTLVSSVAFLVINFASDILYVVLDPRIRVA